MEKSAVASADLATSVRDLALAEYRRSLAETGIPGHPGLDAILDVVVTRTAPRTFSIRVARGGTAPSWDVAADTWVMFAVEALVGPIAAWEGIHRRAWKLWPRPHTP
jgi:hypothetical protein